MVGVEDACSIALGRGDWASVIQQLTEFFYRVTYVGAQHIFTKKLVEHLADRRFQKGDAAGVTRAVPGIGTVLRVVHQRAEKRRCQTIEIGFGFANNMACHEFGRVFKHMNEAVQLAQNVVGNVARGAGLAVQVNRNIGVFVANLFHKGAQGFQRVVSLFQRATAKFFVVDRQNKCRGARLLLRKLRQVTVAGNTNYLPAFFFDSVRKGAYA